MDTELHDQDEEDSALGGRLPYWEELFSPRHRSSGLFLDKKSIRKCHEDDRTATRTALAKLWYGLNGLFPEAERLLNGIIKARFFLDLVENYPRHDAPLDARARKWTSRLLAPAYFQTVHELYSGLASVHQTSMRLLEQGSGQLAGEMKVLIEDRLARNLDVQSAILETMRSSLIGMRTADKPYQVRKLALTTLVDELNEALEKLTDLRRSLKDHSLPTDLRSVLETSEAGLRACGSKLKRWRDNPSAKTAADMRKIAPELIELTVRICEMKDQCFDECLEEGLEFFDRCGRFAR